MDIVLVLLLNVVLIVIGFLVIHARLHRQYNARNFLESIQSEVQRIMAAFNQSADDQIQILDDRIRQLQILKQESTELIRRLEEIKAGPAARTPSPWSAVAERPAPTPAVAAAAPAAPPVRESVPEPLEREAREAELREPEPRDLDPREQVLVLHRQGMAPSIIVQRTGVPLGEVELIIRLAGGW